MVAAQIGMELGLLGEAVGTALIAAGLLSVLIFPLGALTVLKRAERSGAPPASEPGRPLAATRA